MKITVKKLLSLAVIVLAVVTVLNGAETGFGFKQRRHETLMPAQPLVIEYLKQIQDTSSPEKQLLPSMEGLQAHTFNNALVAIAFMLENEKERAERILDFYADAADRENQDPTLQNFFYKGQPRGFFQHVAIRCSGKKGNGDLHSGNCTVKAYHHTGDADRWMGDMAWLMFSYKFYKKKYNSNRYNNITALIKDLLICWYKPDPAGGGYIQHGWRKGDSRLHEAHGHHEGNIDCYALFKLTGDTELAENIRIWLDNQLTGKMNLPLDLYSWRVMAYGEDNGLLDIPETSPLYRKTLTINDRKVTGFYFSADSKVDNIWLGGTGAMACAYITCGAKSKGYFYANQLDKCLIERKINGVKTKALPFVLKITPGYEWVDLDKGFISACAWYLFAKNEFNPMLLRFINR
jgi:hypothetical protein